MKLHVKFKETSQRVSVKFREVFNVSDGGYERGYAEGEAVGHTNGYKEGYSSGYETGEQAGEAAGYNSGYEIGAKEGAEVGYAKGEQEGYEKGYADGEVAGEKNGALQYSRTAKFSNLNLFGKKEIEIYMPLLFDATEMFSPVEDGTNNTVEHITLIGDSTCTRVYSMFNMQWRGGPLKHITFNIDFSKVTDGRYFFNNHSGIVTIDGQPLNFSSCTGNLQFNHLSNLEYIRFVPGTVKCNLAIANSGKLSDASIQSIIDGLVDLTGATTQTLSVHKDVGNRLTQAQKDAISAKNWTLVY